MLGDVPQTWDEVWSLEPGVYSWVQLIPFEWQPEDTPSGALRVELSVHTSAPDVPGGTRSAMLSYIDGVATRARYIGERTSSGDYWAKLATATPPQEFDLPITAGYEDQIYQNTYYKTQDGIVHVSFCIRKTTSTAFDSQEVFATLPAGFRPSSELARDVGGDGINLGNGIVATEIHIRTNGEMYIWGVNFQINWVYGEVSFRAAD